MLKSNSCLERPLRAFCSKLFISLKGKAWQFLYVMRLMIEKLSQQKKARHYLPGFFLLHTAFKTSSFF
jgi:hypothetical protein